MKHILAAARLLASKRENAVDLVDRYDICRDPDATFAIVPIRVVGEEVIQAVGYGDVRRPPHVVLEHHALSRRTAFLEPFAKALEEYLMRAVRGEFVRVYLPHPQALEVLTILAARYERVGAIPNPNPHIQQPSDQVKRLGYLCRLLKEIYHIPGQQLVVVMTDAIRRHFVTGQIPPKDGHLGALATWLNPPKGGGTQRAADARALSFPTAAMLPRDDDEIVEKKLHLLKKSSSSTHKQRLRSEIEQLQQRAVEEEWNVLQEAHHAFWGRNLGATQHATIIQQNLEYLSYRLQNHVRRAGRALAMSQRYELHELHDGLHRAELIALDKKRFDLERAAGKVFVGNVTAVRKTPRGINPKDHRVDIAVCHQAKIRLRAGQKIGMIGGKLRGEIRSFTPTQSGYDVVLSVSSGITSVSTGGPYRWTDNIPVDRSYTTGSIYRGIKRILGLP